MRRHRERSRGGRQLHHVRPRSMPVAPSPLLFDYTPVIAANCTSSVVTAEATSRSVRAGGVATGGGGGGGEVAGNSHGEVGGSGGSELSGISGCIVVGSTTANDPGTSGVAATNLEKVAGVGAEIGDLGDTECSCCENSIDVKVPVVVPHLFASTLVLAENVGSFSVNSSGSSTSGVGGQCCQFSVSAAAREFGITRMERSSLENEGDGVCSTRSSGAVALRHATPSALRQTSSSTLRQCVDDSRRRRRESWAASVLTGRSTPPPARTVSGEGSNLLAMRFLGHSEPTLSSPMGMSGVSGTGTLDRSLCEPAVGSPLFARRNKLIRQVSHSDARRQRPLSLPISSVQVKKDGMSAVRKAACSRSSLHRRSMIGMTSPVMLRSHSPFTASPMDSPKVAPVTHHFAALAARRSMEARRWSLASLPSSGYGTTPGSSNVSSQCSSQERLHQLQFGVGAVPPSPATVSASATFSVGPPSSSDLLPPVSAPPHIDNRSLRHYSSNESNQSADDDVVAAGLSAVTSCVTGRVSPLVRPRSRSLSSPIRFPLADDEIVMMNTMYKERFPTATRQMEDRLQAMIDDYEQRDCDVEAVSPSAVAVVRFVKHQVMEMVRDCLSKSKEKLITSTYFYELSDNLETLINETCEKSAEAGAVVAKLARRLLLTVARPARLLECLQFDPEQFYQLLTHAEGEAVQCEGVGMSDVPQYVLNKLGLQRDPLSDLTRDLHQLESGEVTPVSSTPKSTDLTSLSSSKVPSESDYEVIKLISNGAYGAVYLVRHRESRLRYAMKRINKQNMVLRNQSEQVFAERDIMSFTDNPFVVSFYCSFETKKHLCLVMEYVEGGDCAALLKVVGVLPVDMARLFFAETVLAVEYLHNFGVVHRDLKPDNLLITAMGHVKLTDFGLSKMGLMSLATNLYEGYIDRETKQFSDKQVFGTPEYIAPEVILRRGYGKPVDWWAMGVVLYEFLVGRVPFFGDTPEELFSHTVNDDIEWPDDSDVIPEARDLITQLLAQDPLQRLGTEGAQEVKIHAFFEDIDWDNLLRQKVEFIPQLENDEDTSYFDTRADRYFHDLEGDTDDTEDSLIFSSFSSCSPRFKKVQTKLELKKCRSHGDSSLSDHSDQSSMSVCGTQDSPAHVSNQPHSLLSSSVMSDPGSAPVFLTTPESSQTESEDVSPMMRRRRRPLRDSTPPLPRLSVSIDDGSCGEHVRELSPVEESDKSPPRTTASPSTTAPPIPTVPPTTTAPPSIAALPTTNVRSSSSSSSSSSPMIPPASACTSSASTDSSVSTPPSGVRTPTLTVTVPSARSPLLTGSRPRSRGLPRPPQHQGVSKSTSASVLNLVIPAVELATGDSLQSPGGSSTASSRDGSPCRELSPLLCSLRAPITVRRGPRGFGFTVRAIRVYLGSSDFYTVHHLVMNVDGGGAAFESGLQPGDLITHVNGQPVQGLLHTQLLRLMMSGGHSVTLRTAPLEHTSIAAGNRPQRLGRLARRCPIQRRQRRREGPGTGSAGAGSAVLVTPAPAVLASGANTGGSGGTDRRRKTPSLLRKLSSRRANAELHQHQHGQRLTRMAAVQPDVAEVLSAVPGPAGTVTQRPVSLHGLKHAIHPSTPPSAPPAASSPASSVVAVNRRKSVGHIPLSPLARTPSPGPSPLPTTRSPSPRPCPVQPSVVVRADPLPVRPSPLVCPPLPRVTITAHHPLMSASPSPLLSTPATPLHSQLSTSVTPIHPPPTSDATEKSTVSSFPSNEKNENQPCQQDSEAHPSSQQEESASLLGQQDASSTLSEHH